MSRTKLIFKNFEIIGKPIKEIDMGQWFTGNPKYPQGNGLPLYSAAIGDGLYIKSVSGIFSVYGSVYFEAKGYVIDGYIPIQTVIMRLEP